MLLVGDGWGDALHGHSVLRAWASLRSCDFMHAQAPSMTPMFPAYQPPPAPNHQRLPLQMDPVQSQEFRSTKTVRNQVHLRKDSIKGQQAGGSPSGHMELSFRFDCTAPCRFVLFCKEGA
jgi:hypothetical protein